MNYASRQIRTAHRLGIALLSIAITGVVSSSIIFGMAGGLDQGHPSAQMAATHLPLAMVAQL